MDDTKILKNECKQKDIDFFYKTTIKLVTFGDGVAVHREVSSAEMIMQQNSRTKNSLQDECK